MSRSIALGLTFLLAAALAATAPAKQDASTHVSLTTRVLGSYAPSRAEEGAGKTRVRAANALIAAVTETHRAELMFGIDDDERAKWSNLPPRADEAGLRLGDCSEAELHAVCDLLAEVLSESGYVRVRDILLADDLLLRGGKPRPGFGAENFWVLIFGEPSVDASWGLQLDGHHLGLNLAFHGDAMGMSPTFLGAQPARFERDGAAYEPLAAIGAAAETLMGSLEEAQRSRAVVGGKRGGNVAATGKDGFVPEPEGLALKELKGEQVQHVAALFQAVLTDMPNDVASARIAALTEDVASMRFSWRGPTAAGSDASFRLQGPSLILEFAGQDLGGNPHDHLHVMYRDPTNEYGAAMK